jgi:hypothetical protein
MARLIAGWLDVPVGPQGVAIPEGLPVELPEITY